MRRIPNNSLKYKKAPRRLHRCMWVLSRYQSTFWSHLYIRNATTSPLDNLGWLRETGVMNNLPGECNPPKSGGGVDRGKSWSLEFEGTFGGCKVQRTPASGSEMCLIYNQTSNAHYGIIKQRWANFFRWNSLVKLLKPLISFPGRFWVSLAKK